MTSSFRFLRIKGIAIGAHWSWLLIAALVVWSLAGWVFPTAYPGLPGEAYLAMAAVAAVLFFGSVLLHELGHALVAEREGVEIKEITLWLLGGVAHLRGKPESPRAEFRVAIAGPVITLALAAAFYGLTWAGEFLGWPATVVAVTDYLAVINVLLLVFNLLPALPLDGGRVLRAALWAWGGRFLQATQWAAGAGKAFGFVLMGLGLVSSFAGAGFGGLWFVLLGWFLAQAAQAEADDALTRQSLRGLHVRDVMRTDPVTVPPDVTVDGFLATAAHARFSTFPVVDQDRLIGLVSLRQAAGVAPGQRMSRTVADIMLPADQMPVVSPDDEIVSTLDTLRANNHRAVVMEDGRVAGMVSGSDLAHAMQVRLLRGLPEEPRAGRRGMAWATGLALLGLLAAFAVFYRPPLLVVTPGPAFDVARDVTIQGRPVTPVTGRYLATTVNLEQPNAWGAIIAGIRPDQEVLRASAVIPQDARPEDYFREQRQLFEQSRRMAAAAGARAVGIDVPIHGTGVQVTGVLPEAPAEDKLRMGDVIVRVNGQPVEHIWNLQETVSSRPAGTSFTLTVERQGAERQIEVQSTDLPRLSHGVGIGITGETRNLRVDLPFEVSFASRSKVAGPSAGLVYATTVADLLAQEDFARGRSIAATGTIRLDGAVGAVGGVEQKAIGADEARAKIFLVPAEEVQEARQAGQDLSVHGVETLNQTLSLLERGGTL
ncbi:site-2 protease family protein [Nonomuraea sp. 10N515B]|uniref:site-2 protease family protein n=1 Tax=Nonomuraea sp. 10N515B TaxID=3457422 RepID=UPI003FCDDD44